MILHGDELGRTQDGNNNTYAQDSEISWVHWDRVDRAAGGVHGRHRQAPQGAPDLPPQAVLHRQDGPLGGRRAAQRHRLAARRRDPDGGQRTGRPTTRRSGCTSTATASPASTPAGQAIVDDHFVLYFNAAHEDAAVTLPPEEYAAAWDVVLDTSGASTESAVHKPGSTLTLAEGSMIVQDNTLLEKGLRNYWGYNTLGVPGPARRRTPRTGDQRPAGRRVQDARRRCTSRDRGHPRRRLQPHPRGEPLRADDQLQGLDNNVYYCSMPSPSITTTSPAAATR